MPEIIGQCEAVERVRLDILQAAPHKIWFLVLGESGTGKELVARAVHRLSPRAGKAFVAVNCGALTDSLLESELYGIDDKIASNVAGRPGLLERANGGTLFLDEIGDMPLAMQVKLLRVLQEGEVVRVGSKRAARPIRIDVRVIAATNKDLGAEIEGGRFREDLYWRLAKWIVICPPLRDRGKDVVELAKQFIAQESPGIDISREAARALLVHRWGPGNIRELQAVVERACVRASGRPRIELRDLDPHFAELVQKRGANAAPEPAEALLKVLGHLGFTSAADLIKKTGIPRSTLNRMLRQLAHQGKVCVTGQGKASRYAVATQTGEASLPELSARQRRALDHVRNSGRITRAEYAEVVGVSIRTASRDLADLVENGLLASDEQPGKNAGFLSPKSTHGPSTVQVRTVRNRKGQ